MSVDVRERIFFIKRIINIMRPAYDSEERASQKGPAAKVAEEVLEMLQTKGYNEVSKEIDEWEALYLDRVKRHAADMAREILSRTGPKFLGVPVTDEQFHALMKAVGFEPRSPA